MLRCPDVRWPDDLRPASINMSRRQRPYPGTAQHRKETRHALKALGQLEKDLDSLSGSVRCLRWEACMCAVAGIALAAVIAGVVALIVSHHVADTGRHVRPIAISIVVLGVSVAVLVAAIVLARTSPTGPTITMRQLQVTVATTISLTLALTIGAELALRAAFPDLEVFIEPAGMRESTGPTGPRGPTGSTGSSGSTGPRGPTGSTGPSGHRGMRGREGAQGPTGPRGPRGEPGPAAPLSGS
jgi:hypothetical protein